MKEIAKMKLELFDAGALSLTDDRDAAVNPMAISQPTKKRPTAQRIYKDLKRRETAAQAVAELERDGMEIFGLTRGQFSLADMIEAVAEKTGPVRMSISTWTAAQVDISRMMSLLNSGRLTGCRWLVDLSFIRRTPELCNQIREQFGIEAIRVMRTHAKFVLLENEQWRVCLRSSMNLNQNPRLESYQIAHDPSLCDWLGAVLEDVWKRQPKELAASGNIAAMGAWWQEEAGRETGFDLDAPAKPKTTGAPVAIVTVGIPGSGKSTWAKQEQARTNAAIIELDNARAEINGNAADQSNTAAVIALRDTWISEAARAARPIIVADTNLNANFRHALYRQLENLGYRVQLKIFDTPHEVCKLRNAARDRVVPYEVMNRLIREFEAQRVALETEVEAYG